MRQRANFEKRFQALANEVPWAEMQLLGIEDDALEETLGPDVLKRYNRRLEKPRAILCAIVSGISVGFLVMFVVVGVVLGALVLAYMIQGIPRLVSLCVAKRANGITRLFMLFMDQGSAEGLSGDLEQRYVAISKEQGHQSASRWFYRELIHSFLSLAFTALKRLSGLEKLIRRIGS
jgi:hypothetical protein